MAALDPENVGTPESEIVMPPPLKEPSQQLYELLQWIDDLNAADLYTRTHSMALNSERKPKYPPHHVRCNFVNQQGVRCCKGEGHEKMPGNAHAEPKI